MLDKFYSSYAKAGFLDIRQNQVIISEEILNIRNEVFNCVLDIFSARFMYEKCNLKLKFYKEIIEQDTIIGRKWVKKIYGNPIIQENRFNDLGLDVELNKIDKTRAFLQGIGGNSFTIMNQCMYAFYHQKNGLLQLMRSQDLDDVKLINKFLIKCLICDFPDVLIEDQEIKDVFKEKFELEKLLHKNYSDEKPCKVRYFFPYLVSKGTSTCEEELLSILELNLDIEYWIRMTLKVKSCIAMSKHYSKNIILVLNYIKAFSEQNIQQYQFKSYKHQLQNKDLKKTVLNFETHNKMMAEVLQHNKIFTESIFSYTKDTHIQALSSEPCTLAHLNPAPLPAG